MLCIDFNDERVKFCYLLAFKDATLRGAYKRQDERESLKKDVMQSMKKYVKNADPLEDVDAFISAVYDENRKKYTAFSYGNAQKAVNMFLKYLYCATIFNAEAEAAFKNCHCPVDSVIIDKMIEQIVGGQKPQLLGAYKALEGQKILTIARYKKASAKTGAKAGDLKLNGVKRKYFEGVVWSGMDKDTYVAMRSLLLAWAKDDNCTQLELDYKYWDSNGAGEEE